MALTEEERAAAQTELDALRAQLPTVIASGAVVEVRRGDRMVKYAQASLEDRIRLIRERIRELSLQLDECKYGSVGVRL
ncbi:MAG: gpW family head-tail joining protein [Pseudomonadota bacterium]